VGGKGELVDPLSLVSLALVVPAESVALLLSPSDDASELPSADVVAAGSLVESVSSAPLPLLLGVELAALLLPKVPLVEALLVPAVALVWALLVLTPVVTLKVSVTVVFDAPLGLESPVVELELVCEASPGGFCSELQPDHETQAAKRKTGRTV
jgi:hypothetical protein